MACRCSAFEQLREQFPRAWLTWRPIAILGEGDAGISDRGSRLGRRARSGGRPAGSVSGIFGAPEVQLRDVLFRRLLRAHACSRCRVEAAGAGGALGVTLEARPFATGDVRVFSGANSQIDFGGHDAPRFASFNATAGAP